MIRGADCIPINRRSKHELWREEFLEGHSESAGDAVQRFDSDFFSAVFQLGKVLSGDLRVIGQDLLRPSALGAYYSDSPPHPNANDLCHDISMAVSFGLNVIHCSPKPDRLKLKEGWEAAVKKSMSKKKPVKGCCPKER
jgi:hypothetical protein